jgi:predicted secreted hydrolase
MAHPLAAVMLCALVVLTGCDDAAQTPATDAAAVDAAEQLDAGPDADPCAPEASQITLPADDRVHDDLVEWWYWTGHLRDDAGHEYGYQVTFFAFGAGAARALLANVAVTDLTDGSYHRAAKFEFGSPERLEAGFTFQLGPQTARGGGGQDVVHAEADDYQLDLTLHTDLPAVLQHGDGYHDYGFGGFTYYYSRPRMTATGTLTVAGEARAVTGTGWFDHQWGDLEAATALGWDWFALNLDDGRDVMLFLVHGEAGDELVGGSISANQCGTTEVPAQDVTITPLGQWESPESGCTFPQGWQVAVGELALEITTRVPEQEMYNQRDNSRTYWEGAVEVTGDATGRGYVELAGYCTAD